MTKRHGVLAAFAVATSTAQAQGVQLPPVHVWGQSTVGAADRAALSDAWDPDAPLRELPVSATVIDARSLRERRPDRLEDLTSLVPGLSVDVSSAGLSSAVKLRGFSITRLQYDGVPDIQRTYSRDLATVERIEVLAGPAAVLFGVTSPGGVVNYVAKLPAFTARTEWGLTVGSDALVRTTLDSTGPLGAPASDAADSSAWAYRVVASARDGHTALADLPTRRQQGLGALTWAYSRVPGAEGSLTLDVQEQRNETPYLFGTVITNDGSAGGGVQPAQVQYDRLYVLPGGAPAMRRYHSGGLRWEQALNDELKLSAQYRQAVVTRDETLLGFWSVETPTELSGYYTSYHDSYRQHNLRVQAEGRVVTGPLSHLAVLGYAENRSGLHFSGVQNIGGFALDVAAPDFSTVDVNALPTTQRYNDEKQRDVSWWLADRVSFGAIAYPAHLTFGIRHLRYAIDGDRSGTGRVPRASDSGTAGHLGLSTAPSSALQAYLAWSSGLEPNRGKTSGGDFLPAQQSRQWEVGTHWQVAPLTQLHLAAYRVDLLNLPMTDPLDRTASISAGQRRVHGAEASFETTWAAWQLQANINAQRTRQVVKTTASLGDSFVGVPRSCAGLQLAHDFGVSAGLPLRAWAAATVLGPRFADAQNTVQVAGYARIDAGGEYLIATGRTLSAGVRNLGNRRYVEAVTALDDVYQGPLRQMWVTLSLAL